MAWQVTDEVRQDLLSHLQTVQPVASTQAGHTHGDGRQDGCMEGIEAGAWLALTVTFTVALSDIMSHCLAAYKPKSVCLIAKGSLCCSLQVYLTHYAGACKYLTSQTLLCCRWWALQSVPWRTGSRRRVPKCPAPCSGADCLWVTAGHADCLGTAQVSCSCRAPAAWPSTPAWGRGLPAKSNQPAWAAAESCLANLLKGNLLHAAAPPLPWLLQAVGCHVCGWGSRDECKASPSAARTGGPCHPCGPSIAAGSTLRITGAWRLFWSHGRLCSLLEALLHTQMAWVVCVPPSGLFSEALSL